MNTTIRLYQQDPYLRSCESKVLSVDLKKSCITLDRTVFFPEGGGQPSDMGIISGAFGNLEIEHVFELDGIVYHQFKNGTSYTVDTEIVGSTVTCHLDWNRRFVHMQRHCGEHILSAAFYELFGGVNRGFHMGADYMTIDISLEENPDFTQMTDEMMRLAELESNRMVWDNLPVTTRYFKHRHEADGLPMRKALNVEEDIVLVCVGDESKAAGCVACCGTHPRTTGQVGLIKLFRWENYKGMIRITFDAGPNALANCRMEADIIKDLCVQFSSDEKNLMEKIQQREQRNREIRQELYEIKQAYLRGKANDIIERFSDPAGVISVKYELLKADDLLAMAKMLSDIKNKLIALISVKESTLILLSDGQPDCNKIVKDNAQVWRGKGGGRANNARAMFPSMEELDCFLDYIHKAY